jgi:hypothetical protein
MSLADVAMSSGVDDAPQMDVGVPPDFALGLFDSFDAFDADSIAADAVIMAPSSPLLASSPADTGSSHEYIPARGSDGAAFNPALPSCASCARARVTLDLPARASRAPPRPRTPPPTHAPPPRACWQREHARRSGRTCRQGAGAAARVARAVRCAAAVVAAAAGRAMMTRSLGVGAGARDEEPRGGGAPARAHGRSD